MSGLHRVTGEVSLRDAEIAINRVIQGPATPAVLSFTAASVKNVRDRQFMERIAIALRGLCAAMAECLTGTKMTISIRRGVSSVLVGIDNHSEAEINDMA